MLQSTPKEPRDKFQPSPDRPQGKKTQISHRFVQAIGHLSWLSVCVLTIWYFQPFDNAGLQSPRDPPSPQPVSTLQQSILRLKIMLKPILTSKIRALCKRQLYYILCDFLLKYEQMYVKLLSSFRDSQSSTPVENLKNATTFYGSKLLLFL